LRCGPIWDAAELERWNEARPRRTNRPQAQASPTSLEEALRAIETLGQRPAPTDVSDDAD
jgi:hypothetical protein